jgi:CRP-like cAMP-binding protein
MTPEETTRELRELDRAEPARAEGFAAAHAAEPNHILAGLSLADYARVLPQLVPKSLRFKQVLYEPNEPISQIYFVRDGVVSIIATEEGENAIEVGLIGREGFAGLPVLYGLDSLPYRVLIQIEGDAWRLSTSSFRAILAESPALEKLCLRYAQYFTIQVSQSVACNRLHTVEERCARWLLMTADRVDGEAFDITHEFMAIMLGVRRAGVTVAMATLQSAGIVQHGRGRVRILDRAALEAASCGCYRVTRDTWDKVAARDQ